MTPDEFVRRGQAAQRAVDDVTGIGSRPIPESAWRWFGCAGHLIVARECRFHLCTQVGGVLVSTVGEYFPDSELREIFAATRGITLKGRGDERRDDYMRKVGFEEIGYGRIYETMVFHTMGDVCHHPNCACGLPAVDFSALAMRGYTVAGAATIGHMDFCRQYASAPPPTKSGPLRAHALGCPETLSVPVDLCSCGGRDVP